MKLDELTRRQIRYWLFRFRTAEEAAGTPAKGAPAGLRKRFEGHPHFAGWANFGVTWDVSDENPFVLVPLKLSLEVQWNTEAMASARELPKPEE